MDLSAEYIKAYLRETNKNFDIKNCTYEQLSEVCDQLTKLPQNKDVSPQQLEKIKKMMWNTFCNVNSL